jgi:hypothetical protein
MPVNYVSAIPMTSKNAAALTGGFDVVTTGLPEACSILRIINDSNSDVIISYDGATNHDYLVGGTTLQIDAQANSQPNSDVSQFRKGQKVYVKGTAGIGFVYVVAYYNRQ